MGQPKDIGDLTAEPGGLLALDVSKTMTGWVYVDPGALKAWPDVAIGKNVGPHKGVCYGGRSFAEWPYEQFVLRFSRWLHDSLDRWQPTRIVSEEAVYRPTSRGKINADSTARVRIMFGARAIVTLHGMIRGIPVQMIEHQSAKLHFTGGGAASKADVVAVAERRGWRPQSDDVADAFALADTAIALERSVATAANMQARVNAATTREQAGA